MPDYSSKYNSEVPQEDKGLFEKFLESLPEYQRNNYDYDISGAFLEGMQNKSNGHFSDKYKKPNHPTFSKDSKYSGVDGNVGGEWMRILGKDVFVPSKTNFEMNDPEFLRKYFENVEPNALLFYDLKDLLKAFPQFNED